MTDKPRRLDSSTDAKTAAQLTQPFYLGVYEVTQQQYEKVMGARPWWPVGTQGEEYVKAGSDYPATWVSHHDAVAFCRKLSKQEGVEYRFPCGQNLQLIPLTTLPLTRRRRVEI